jgi:hypothetical protein
MLVESLTKNEYGKKVSINLDSVTYTGELTSVNKISEVNEKMVVTVDSYRLHLDKTTYVKFI